MTAAIKICKSLAILLCLQGLVFFGRAQDGAGQGCWLQSLNRSVAVRLSDQGVVTGIQAWTWPEKQVRCYSELDGCHAAGKVEVGEEQDGSMVFTVEMRRDSTGELFRRIERFTPVEGSIRWQLQIEGKGSSWGTVIRTRMHYPAGEGTRFWTAWGRPPGSAGNIWTDPLVATPFCKARFDYGAPHLDNAHPQIGFSPTEAYVGEGNLFCIPLVSVMETSAYHAYTLALSPEDDIIDLTLETSAAGDISFNRLFNRLGGGNTVSFSMDLIANGADFRGGLSWMSERYPKFFNPSMADAGKYGGTGAYSNHALDFDIDKMKKMAFTVNWQASFDFPYMGMFLPPVGPDTRWTRYGKGETSIRAMNAYAAAMKRRGFYVFNYFNVTEFGAHVKWPYVFKGRRDDRALWKDCNRFLYGRLAGAILQKPGGGPYYTWGEGIAMDCGDSVYRAFLLEQARRHIREIPDAFGICIDRMDWLRMYNMDADDGKSWFEGKPARSLVNSFKGLMKDLGPLMHEAGKSILVNNHDKRIDLLKDVDGIFDEFTYSGIALNTSALLGMQKPVLGWTDAAARIRAEGGDAFFQRYLYMGVYPMCPFPGNDHSIGPDSVTDQWYLDYGPLMNLMRGRRWVLDAPLPSVYGGKAKVNLFSVGGGYLIPVVYGEKGLTTVRVGLWVDDLPRRHVYCEAWHPGAAKPVRVFFQRDGESMSMDVPLVRGCAMVTVKWSDVLPWNQRDE